MMPVAVRLADNIQTHCDRGDRGIEGIEDCDAG